MSGTLIYIGASLLQVPGIRWAKEQGLRVVVTDVNPEAPGIQYADGYEQIAGDDAQALVQLGAEIARNDRLAGCYCGSDFGLRALAQVGQAHNVPAPAPESVELALDKAASCRVLDESGVAVPKGGIIENPGDLGPDIETPIIVKPADSSGSRGVRTVTSLHELEVAFTDARRYSDTVIAETLVQGHHIDVNGLFIEGAFFPCGLLSRFFSPDPHNYPIWGCEPCLLDEAACAQTYDAVETGARALGIATGPVKADVIYTDDGPVILEIAPRFHGDVSTSFVTPIATGTSAPRAWFAYLAGRRFHDFLPKDDGDVFAGWMGVFPDTPGVFQSIDGLEAAKRLPGIADVAVLKKPGYPVAEIADNLAVMGFIWGQAETSAALQDRLQGARKALHVRLTNEFGH